MSTISPDQLPSPVQAFGAPSPTPFSAPFAGPAGVTPPSAATPRRRSNGRLIAAAVAGLVLAGGGVAAATRDSSGAAHANERRQEQPDRTGGDTGPTDPTNPPVDTPSSDLGPTDIARAYQAVFGVQGGANALDCVETELSVDATAARHTVDFLEGSGLSVSEAQVAFTPFVACAPDVDFLASMVPAAITIVGGRADESCVSGILQSFGVEGRAEAFALAYADAQQFQDRMFSTFAQCVA